MRKKVKLNVPEVSNKTEKSKIPEKEVESVPLKRKTENEIEPEPLRKEPENEVEPEPLRLVKVKFGKPLLDITFRTIKILATMSFCLIICNIMYSMKLFISSIKIRQHLGYFINMISEGDGSKLPVLQAMPALGFLIVDVIFSYFLFKIFNRKQQVRLNWFLYLTVMVALGLILITFILSIVILGHVHGNHEKLHNGIVEAMHNYSSNSLFKKRIDRLQIEFQCCGSKKYDEWYNITWYDTSLVKKGSIDKSHGNTPFSCCSISSIFPCIHHNIEKTGKAYLYTPEQNLSISTKGCYDGLRKKTKEVGWSVVGNLVLFVFLQMALMICLRFLQTAHSARNQFEGHSRLYTVWLFGCGSVVTETEVVLPVPPKPPPVPQDLMSL
ncbi:hypothetical protein JTB14_027144 [Gonioctena quinquepunctata]|nr:hypothetical protein JTB14_027144 [Gonioctena quinquepunctata]